MKYKAILFDLDGTTLNTLPDLWHSANHALKELGFPERSFDEVRRFVGNGVGMLMRRALPHGVSDFVWEESVRLQKSYYNSHLAVDTVPYVGVIPMLQTLKKEGYMLGTVSNKYDEAVQALMDLYFPHLFDAALGSKEGVPLKPDRSMVDCLLEQFHIRDAETIYVGDSEVDYQTALNSNTLPILVDWGFRPRAQLEVTGAENIVSSITELYDTIRLYEK
ncbi:MAG: HAD family hydrolase [Oscillospiraceae bacterium]|nr:HAD family hydrolase [Oscillospiraceae bacterium]